MRTVPTHTQTHRRCEASKVLTLDEESIVELATVVTSLIKTKTKVSIVELATVVTSLIKTKTKVHFLPVFEVKKKQTCYDLCVVEWL